MHKSPVNGQPDPIYQNFLDNIYNRFSANVKYGLERIISVLREMNNPEASLQGIHVAGTNGKGSTAAMCEAIALADKKITGLNTSPHLVDYRERFRLNGKQISIPEIISNYGKWRHVFDKWEASFFEITTAMAFDLFNENKVETSIFEVGLGGRLDGTNPFNSTVTIITSISLDHRKTLGDTIEKIAYEKAGIIKAKVPVVVGKLIPQALDVIKETAKSKEAPLYYYDRDYSVENVVFNNQGTTYDLIIKSEDIPLPGVIRGVQTNMVGQHQARNSALSIIAYSIFKQYLKESLDLQLILQGLKNVDWKGRMQIISSKPMSIIDCAHNEEGIENLVVNLSLLYPDKKYIFVVAILRDKDFAKMIQSMSSIASKIYIAKNSSERAADPDEQSAIVNNMGVPCSIGSSVEDAYYKALDEASANDIIIVTGSIYTVSELIPKITGK